MLHEESSCEEGSGEEAAKEDLNACVWLDGRWHCRDARFGTGVGGTTRKRARGLRAALPLRQSSAGRELKRKRVRRKKHSTEETLVAFGGPWALASRFASISHDYLYMNPDKIILHQQTK